MEVLEAQGHSKAETVHSMLSSTVTSGNVSCQVVTRASSLEGYHITFTYRR
jgi:hypothetical protein